jgi:hypothetical protein
MTYGISAMDMNTARYVQSMQAADGLSDAAVSSIYNQSVFGTGGFGYSTIPFAGTNPSQMLEYQKQYNDNNRILSRQNIDNNLIISQQQRAASQLSTASDDSISRQISSLQRQVQSNKQDNIMTEYNKLLEAVAQYYQNAGYTNVSEAQIKTTAERLYAQQTSMPLIDDIKAHGHNSFVQGFKQVMSFGVLSGKSADENVAAITGENANDTESKVGKWAGRITAGVVAAESALWLTKFAKSNAGKTAFKILKKVLLP